MLNSPDRAKVLCIASGKGGTGKSIIASSIGYVLSLCDKKVLLVDFDLFTHGLTFFIIGDRPISIQWALTDAFSNSADEHREIDIIDIDPELFADTFCLLPSISSSSIEDPEILRFPSLPGISDMVSEINKTILTKENMRAFDYIIIDTRGGTDATSVAAVISSDTYILVTEADKPSWDMGDILIKTIESYAKAGGKVPERGGFILNKNVLPDDAVTAFLRKKWRMQHLATIPLDEDVVKNFQQDTIPISDTMESVFSYHMVNVVKLLTSHDRWGDEKRAKLRVILDVTEKYMRSRDAKKEEQTFVAKFPIVFRFYGTVLSTLLLAYLVVKPDFLGGRYLDTTLLIGIIVLIFAMTAIEPKFLFNFLLKLMRRDGDTKRD